MILFTNCLRREKLSIFMNPAYFLWNYLKKPFWSRGKIQFRSWSIFMVKRHFFMWLKSSNTRIMFKHSTISGDWEANKGLVILKSKPTSLWNPFNNIWNLRLSWDKKQLNLCLKNGMNVSVLWRIWLQVEWNQFRFFQSSGILILVPSKKQRILTKIDLFSWFWTINQYYYRFCQVRAKVIIIWKISQNCLKIGHFKRHWGVG